MANTYSGSIFAFAIVAGRSIRLHDDYKHFRGTIYAPLDNVYVFDNQIRSDDFSDILRIGQNTITPVDNVQFELLRERLSKNNQLPTILKSARSGRIGFRNITRDNWDAIGGINNSFVINCTPVDVDVNENNQYVNCNVESETGRELFLLQASQQFSLYTGKEFPLEWIRSNLWNHF